MYFAVLAANNGRSHSHNETGSYIIYQDGQPVAIDVGVEAYTAKTFSPERYTIWTMQSAYHNLPTIGGVMQHDGVKFQATDRKFDSNGDRATYSFKWGSCLSTVATTGCVLMLFGWLLKADISLAVLRRHFPASDRRAFPDGAISCG